MAYEDNLAISGSSFSVNAGPCIKEFSEQNRLQEVCAAFEVAGFCAGLLPGVCAECGVYSVPTCLFDRETTSS